MAENRVDDKQKDREEGGNKKKSNLFKRLFDWIAKGAKKASEIGALCGP